MKIILNDYGKENAFFLKRIRSNIENVAQLRSEFEHEQYLERFEKEFARFNGSKYTIAVNSGTTALELALRSVGVEKNDEVILPAYTYISTALAVSNLGAIPVFADIKETTLTIDPQRIEQRLTKKTKAIIPVHIHGNPCAMDKIIMIARKNKLAIVEDCSHAHGAEYKSKKVGNFGIGCFSCHASKVLGGIGNGGLITLNDKQSYETIKTMLHVSDDPDPLLSNRTPCRMDAIQAAVLSAKLPFLEKMITRKRKIARKYEEALLPGLNCQKEEADSRHVYRDFVITVENRDAFKRWLMDNGIESKVRYEIPLYRARYYRHLSYKVDDFPVTEKVFSKLLCLPVSFVMNDTECSYICKAIKQQLAGKMAGA